MIGMAILGIVLGASLMAIPEMRELSYRSDRLRSGFTVLNSELENLRTQTFDQLATSITGPAEVEDDNDEGGGGGLLGGLGGFLGFGGQEEQEETTPTSVYTQGSVKLNNIDYGITRQLEFVNGNQAIIRSTVVVDWPGGQTLTGQAIFTQDGLSDKKFSTAN